MYIRDVQFKYNDKEYKKVIQSVIYQYVRDRKHRRDKFYEKDKHISEVDILIQLKNKALKTVSGIALIIFIFIILVVIAKLLGKH